MSEIKKYEPVDNDGFYYHGNIKESKYGDYVLFTDYESEHQAHLQTKKELEELQDYLCDYFAMEAWKSPESLLAKHIEASRQRNK